LNELKQQRQQIEARIEELDRIPPPQGFLGHTFRGYFPRKELRYVQGYKTIE
jgi:hypothetical protein